MALSTVTTERDKFNWQDLTVLRNLLPPYKGETIGDYFWRCKKEGLITEAERKTIAELNEKNLHKTYLQ